MTIESIVFFALPVAAGVAAFAALKLGNHLYPAQRQRPASTRQSQVEGEQMPAEAEAVAIAKRVEEAMARGRHTLILDPFPGSHFEGVEYKNWSGQFSPIHGKVEIVGPRGGRFVSQRMAKKKSGTK